MRLTLSDASKKRLAAGETFRFEAIRIARQPDFTWRVEFLLDGAPVGWFELGYEWVPSHGGSLTLNGMGGTIDNIP